MNVDTGLGSLVDAVNNLRKFAEESDNQERIDIKINGEKKLRELNEQLEKLDKTYEANININIPDIKRQIDDLYKQIDDLNIQRANASEKLLRGIGDVANKYFDTDNVNDAKELINLIRYFNKVSGQRFSIDLVPNLKRPDYQNESWIKEIKEQTLNGYNIDMSKIQKKYKDEYPDYSKDISNRQNELNNLQEQLNKINIQIEKYDATRLDLLNKIRNAEEELRRIEEEISKKEQERIQRENENQRQKSDQSWKTGRQKRSRDDYEDDFQFSDEEIDFDDAEYSDDIADLNKIYDVLNKIYDIFERINKSIGSIDDDSGLKNVLSQLDDIFKRLADIQEKAGNGIFNVQIGGASTIDEQVNEKWTEIQQRYLKTYDKLFNELRQNYLDPDLLFSKIYQMNPNLQNIDKIKTMFNRDEILSLDDPSEIVRRLSRFFEYVQKLGDAASQEQASFRIQDALNKQFKKQGSSISELKLVPFEGVSELSEDLKKIKSPIELEKFLNTIDLSVQSADELKDILKTLFKFPLYDMSDNLSQVVSGFTSKQSNRVDTNFKAVQGRVDTVRNQLLEESASVEEIVKNAVRETQEANESAENWELNLLRIKKVLEEIAKNFNEIAKKDIFNTESFTELKSIIEDISNTLKNLTIQQDNSVSEDIEKITNAFKTEQETAIESTNTENNAFSELKQQILSVVEAINEKTNAFTQEKIAVETAIQYEISQLDSLISKLEEVRTGSRIDLLFEAQNDTGLSSLDSAVNNISQSVNEKNEKFRQEDDIVNEVVNSEILKLAELQTALEEVQQAIRNKTQEFDTERNLMVSSIDIEIQKLQELKAEFDLLQNQNLSTDQLDNKNTNNLSNLESSLLNIINLINEKTAAFNTEGQVVDSVIQSEYDKLMMLAESLRIITESISKIKIPDNQTPEWIKDLSQFDTDKIQTISTSLSEMYEAISKFNISDSNLLTSINQILNKGQELQNLVKVLSASKKDIDKTKQKVAADQDRESKASYAKELKYYQKLYEFLHKIDTAKAQGNDESVVRDKYRAEINLYNDLIQKERERRQQQNLNSTEREEQLAKEIQLIERKNKAEIEGIEKTRLTKENQEFKDKNIADSNSQIKDLERVKEQLENLLNQKTKNLTPKYIQDANNQITKLNNQIQALEDAKIDIIDSQDISALKKASISTEKIINDTKKIKSDATDSANKLAKEIKIKNLDEEITDFLTKNTKLSAEFRAELDALRKKLSGNNLSNQDILDVASAFAEVKTKAKEAGDVGKSAIDTIKQRLGDMNAKYLAQFLSLNDIIRYGRTIVNTIKELDYALVDLRKTTTMSASDLNEFYLDASNIGKNLGQTTEQIISQAAAWSRLGYSAKEEATTMAELSSKFALISPGMSLDDATDGLVSTMKGFNIEVENTERTIMDNVNRIGNTFATSNSEIMEMLKRSSAAMNEANNTLEQTIALESAAVQVTRNAETTGTAFRTISMRIRGKQSLPPYTVMYMLCA